ncbi:outer membrane protein [Bosea lathyri]|uniref:Outer membrane immunogenic protein n=1 Tax=Bosea lathyri TaxID=1036778 RepID=A0A1H5ZJH8_9HYPH|nr:outer membrane beta-barrel protein [Bosea lathyri]SEG36240.1 outer membrane immunogenic protein [Bosea lathyri]
MKRLLSLLPAAVIFLGSPALSADLPTRNAVAPPPLAPAFTWTGFYVGANAGYSWNESRSRFGYLFGGADDVDIAQFNASGIVPGQLGRSKGGFIGGAQLGYNRQLGQIVLGVEADLQYLRARQRSGHLAFTADGDDAVTVATTAQSSIDWLGTLRGRVGFAADRTLYYATGGLAFERTSSRATISAVGVQDGDFYAGVWSGARNRNSLGWTVGGGIEHALTDNLTIKAEYLYYDLGRSRYAVSGYATDPTDDFRGANVRGRTNGSIMRAGLNWKFTTF